jgi:gliding motility-associated-like protein
MKPFLVLLLITLSTTFIKAQTFTGSGGAIPGTSTSRTCFNNTVTGVGVINSTYGLAQVCMNITHPNDDELEIILTAPDGTIVPLSVQNGGTGNNYTGTCFTATAANSIKFGTAPFTGIFLPEGHLGAMNNGQNANGVWQLCIQDRRTVGNAGSLVNWSLTFNNAAAPQPPLMQACSVTLPGTSSCTNATAVCDFNGLCGNTSGTTIQDWTGSGLNACFGLENNSFVKFVASSTSASFSVWVPTTTTGGYNTAGIQMLFFSGTCNSGPVTTYGCYPHIYPYPSAGNPLITVVSATGLTPGNTYYLMIDGFNGDKCTFTIEANSGVNILNITPATPTICSGSSIPLTATGGNGTYSWSPSLGLSATSGATVTASPTGTTTYTITSSTSGSCPITKDVTVTVNPIPSAPVLTVTNNCGSSTITASGVTGTITWSDAGTGNPRTVTTAGTFTATQTVGGCTSISSNSITTAPTTTPPAPVLTVTNNCGSSTITASGVTGTITWSDAGTGNPRTVTTAGTFTATQTVGGCTSISSNTITTAPTTTPPAPVLTVTNNCGSSTITASGITGTITWSDAGTGNPRTVTTAGTFTATQTVGGCTSISSNGITTAPTATPATPTATITQATCNLPKATILITTPTGANLEYSINGIIYQSASSFPSVNPGNYNITARYIGTNCISAPKAVTINPLNSSLCGDDIYFPTAFTPNGDGNNDGFGPGPLSNLAGITEYSMSVYNRYGQLVFISINPYEKWDGSFKGQLLVNYAYVWQASYKKSNGKSKSQKGTVTIIK